MRDGWFARSPTRYAYGYSSELHGQLRLSQMILQPTTRTLHTRTIHGESLSGSDELTVE